MPISSPWNTIKPIGEAQSLQEIMSEEIAQDIQSKEKQKLAEFITSSQNEAAADFSAEILTHILKNHDSDAAIAQVLQMQYDNEFKTLQKTEDQKQKFTGSKVNLPFFNYSREKDTIRASSDEDSDDYGSEYEYFGNQHFNENGEEQKDWDQLEKVGHQFNTKHDISNSRRRNNQKLMEFPPEFQTGDGAEFNKILSSKVLNGLKAHSRTEQTRRRRNYDKKEEHATATMGVDTKTCLILYKLVSSVQLIEEINGVISTGKEAMILHCDSNPDYPVRTVPKECAIKIFKTTLNEFKTRDKYIEDDQRFKNKFGKQNPRKLMHLFAEKESHNLMRMAKVGIPCPEVVFLRKHVLVMSFIGRENIPAKQLRHPSLSFANLCNAHQQVIENVRKLYQDAHLVHADLSEYNILWHDNKCWFIDVSQAVEYQHPSAFEFLLRDLTNIYNFFNKKGVPDLRTPSDMFQDIVDQTPEEAIKSQRKQKKMKPHLMDRPDVEQLQENIDWLDEYNVDESTEALETVNIAQLCVSLAEAPQA